MVLIKAVNVSRIATVVCMCCCMPFMKGQGRAETKLILLSETAPSKAIEYYTESASMVLNLANGDFVLNANLADLHTGDRRLDSLIGLQDEQPLLFKGNIGENVLAYSQQQNDEKNYSMQGQLFINGSSLGCTAQFDPLNFADKSEAKNYRMDFKLQVDPDKIPFRILDLKFTKQITLEVIAGRLNTQN